MKCQGDYVLLRFELYYTLIQVVKGYPDLVSLKYKNCVACFLGLGLKNIFH